jgi:hypothetical protein
MSNSIEEGRIMKPRIMFGLLTILFGVGTSAWADTVTYEISNSVDDTRGFIWGSDNVNHYTYVAGWFGRFYGTYNWAAPVFCTS